MDQITAHATKLIQILKSGDAEAVPYYLAALILLKQSYVFRYLRRGILPVGAVAIAYRLTNGANNNLSQLIAKWVESAIRCGRVRGVIGDILGLITVAGLLSCTDQLIAAFKLLIRQPNAKKTVMNAMFEFIRPLPIVQRMIREETESKGKELELGMKAKTIEYNAQFGANTVLPVKGKRSDEILSMMHSLAEAENTKWQAGKVTGSVYHGSKVRMR
jgi:hypothetical protein